MVKTIIESSKINYIIVFAHFRMNENEKTFQRKKNTQLISIQN